MRVFSCRHHRAAESAADGRGVRGCEGSTRACRRGRVSREGGATAARGGIWRGFSVISRPLGQGMGRTTWRARVTLTDDNACGVAVPRRYATEHQSPVLATQARWTVLDGRSCLPSRPIIALAFRGATCAYAPSNCQSQLSGFPGHMRQMFNAHFPGIVTASATHT